MGVTRWARAFVCVVAVALVAAACTGGSGGQSGTKTGTSTGPAPSTVTVAIRDDIDTFDPYKSAGAAGATQILFSLYDTLVRVPVDGKGSITPDLATSWKQSGASWVFQISDKGVCDDGTHLTPSDVARSLQRLADPKTASSWTSRVFGPSGAKTITADDSAGTVTVTTNAPYTDLVTGMSYAPIICPAGLADTKTLASKPFGSGPYQLVSAQRGNQYTLKFRPGYQLLPAGTTANDVPKTLVYKVVEDSTTTANLLITHEINIGSILGQDYVRFKNNPGFNRIDGAGFGADALVFNQRPGLPGNDPAVRRAIAMAVNAQDTAVASSFGLANPMTTLYTPNMDCYNAADAAALPKYDPTAAKQVLEQDGYVMGSSGKLEKDGHPLVVRLLGYTSQNSAPEYLLTALEKIGITAQLSDGSFEQALNVLFGTGAWDLFLFPYNSGDASPMIMYFQVTGPTGSLNVGNIQNKEYISLAQKAAESTGPSRCQYWDEAERALLSNVDVVPVQWDVAAWYGGSLTFQADYWRMDPLTIRSG